MFCKSCFQGGKPSEKALNFLGIGTKFISSISRYHSIPYLFFIFDCSSNAQFATTKRQDHSRRRISNWNTLPPFPKESKKLLFSLSLWWISSTRSLIFLSWELGDRILTVFSLPLSSPLKSQWRDLTWKLFMVEIRRSVRNAFKFWERHKQLILTSVRLPAFQSKYLIT